MMVVMYILTGLLVIGIINLVGLSNRDDAI
jgi:hypothetical protein